METTSSARKPLFDPTTEARGRWPEIFKDLAGGALDEAMNHPGHHVSCPVHGGKSGDGFRLFKTYVQDGGGICNSCGGKSNGFAVLSWLKGYAFKDAVREVSNWIRGGSDMAAVPIKRKLPPAPVEVIDYAGALAKINEVWLASKPIQGTVAELYLAKRGIFRENIPPSLRFHPGLKFWDPKEKKDYGVFPCMLAPVKDKNGLILSIHRTFLTPEGDKAPVPEPKKLMAKCADLGGSAIKLWTPRDVLGLAEGIETALAARAIARIPVWSCVSAVLMELVEIPESVRHVVIWADLDRTRRGEIAADKIADRIAEMGKTVEIVLPNGPIPENKKGVDWLDVLLTEGLEGFPPRWRNYMPA